MRRKAFRLPLILKPRGIALREKSVLFTSHLRNGHAIRSKLISRNQVEFVFYALRCAVGQIDAGFAISLGGRLNRFGKRGCKTDDTTAIVGAIG